MLVWLFFTIFPICHTVLTLFLSLGRIDEWTRSIYDTPFDNNLAFFRFFLYSFGFLSILIFWTYVPVCYCAEFDYRESYTHLNEHIVCFILLPCCFNLSTNLLSRSKYKHNDPKAARLADHHNNNNNNEKEKEKDNKKKRDQNGKNDRHGNKNDEATTNKKNVNGDNSERPKSPKDKYMPPDQATVIQLSPQNSTKSKKKKPRLKNHATFDTETPHMHSFDAEAKAESSVEDNDPQRNKHQKSLEVRDENLDDLAIIIHAESQVNKDKHVINTIVSKNSLVIVYHCEYN